MVVLDLKSSEETTALESILKSAYGCCAIDRYSDLEYNIINNPIVIVTMTATGKRFKLICNRMD